MATYSSGKKKDVIRPHEDLPAGHPSIETRNRHPDDQRLRSHGFFIVSRPRTGPNRWGLGRDHWGKPVETMTEAEAFQRCLEAEALEKAK